MKNRKKIFLIVASIIILLTILIAILFYPKIKPKKEWEYETKRLTHFIVTPKEGTEEKSWNTIKVYTFDKEDICIDSRVQYTFPTIEEAEALNKNFQETNKTRRGGQNVKLSGNTITFNYGVYNGFSKKKVFESLTYSDYIIREL